MTNKERLNEKVAHTEKILKWIKVLNDTDKHEELMNAIWFLQHFTQDIHDLWSETVKWKDWVVTKFQADISDLPLLKDIHIPIQADTLTNEIRCENQLPKE